MVEMTALPKVSATETADLRDVYRRLGKLGHGNVYGPLFVGMHGVALEVTYTPKGGSK